MYSVYRIHSAVSCAGAGGLAIMNAETRSRASIRQTGVSTMKMTIRKIAELAGTSRSAVDKVIHDRPGVSEAVRQEVLRVIEQTGYVPLHERRTAGAPNPRVHTVAVFLPPLNNPYFRRSSAVWTAWPRRYRRCVWSTVILTRPMWTACWPSSAVWSSRIFRSISSAASAAAACATV